ncbi:MAG: hypothetical protein ACP5II_03740 [Infirmifilum sp.]|uniref:hypothetical protein n=1 Tax=Infirmifilum TaxID=2856573 RepID=UPI0023565125
MQTTIAFTYLQAEKFAEPPPTPLNVNMQVNFPLNISLSEKQLSAEFVVSVESVPAVFSVKIKGKFTLTGDSKEIEEVNLKLSKGSPDPQLLQMLTSLVFFEVMLLLKELGFPPMLPLQPPPQQPPPETFRPA